MTNSTHDNPAYDKLRGAVSRALWEHSNFDADNGEYILPEDIRPPTDEYDCCADVVLKVVRDEIEAMVHGGDYYEQFEAGQRLTLLDAETLLRKVSDDHAR